MNWECCGLVFDTSEPVVMGIVNVTPDSFSDGGQHATVDAAVAHALKLVGEGAAIIDVGGESTRPGSSAPSVEEETARVLPVVETLVERGVCVSVDTRHVEVAAACLEAGAHIINDVSGFRDEAMRRVVAESNCGCVVMHMLGEPQSMQQQPEYADVVAEVEAYLLHQAALLEELGVARERICLDPGVGFGKTAEHNRLLLEATPRFAALPYPLMVAVSRKSYIGACTGIEVPAQRDVASALCSVAAMRDGAFVARMHDVAGTCEVLQNARRAIVALGSNMGDRRAQLDAAVEALRTVEGVWVVRVSDYVESAPAYKEEQPAFANAVAEVLTVLGPQELLDALHAIEDAAGRVRKEANGPRTLDLDIVDFEDVVSDDPQLTLPHPLALERGFVVEPLLQLCGEGYTLANGTPVTRDAVVCGVILAPLG